MYRNVDLGSNRKGRDVRREERMERARWEVISGSLRMDELSEVSEERREENEDRPWWVRRER